MIVDPTRPMLTPAQAVEVTGYPISALRRVVGYYQIGPRMVRFDAGDIDLVVAHGLEGARQERRRRRDEAAIERARLVGRVYFVEAVGTDRIKIGWTRSLENHRLRRLQTASPFELREVAWLPGTRKDEHALHVRYAAARIQSSTEWFFRSPEIDHCITTVRLDRRLPL